MNNIKQAIRKSFSTKKFKNGAYSTAISAVVIILILVINLIAGQMNLKVDVSGTKMFTLTKDTKEMVKSLQDEITLYYMAGNDTTDTLIKQLVDQYKGISSKLKVVEKDPVLYPKFTDQFTPEEVSPNSVIVVNETKDRSRVVNYSDMLVSEVDYQTYSSYVTGVDVEGKVTSAIQYVISEKLPVMYAVEGHGEAALNDSVNTSLDKGNITTKSIQTLTAKEIPEDCSLLLINGPQYDFTKEEASLIGDYLKNGGKAVIFASYTEEAMPNFDEILKTYGISLVDGIVVEGDENQSMPNTPTYLVPEISYHEITAPIQDKKIPIVIPIGKGINIEEKLPEGVTATSILDTSNKAYAKINVNTSSYLKEKGDIDGPFHLGVAVTGANGEKETKLAVYSSAYILDESMVAYKQFANADLLINSIKWMAETDVSLSIPTKSLESTYITMNAGQLKLWSTIVIGIIPLAILGVGAIVVIKRRRG